MRFVNMTGMCKVLDGISPVRRSAVCSCESKPFHCTDQKPLANSPLINQHPIRVEKSHQFIYEYDTGHDNVGPVLIKARYGPSPFQILADQHGQKVDNLRTKHLVPMYGYVVVLAHLHGHVAESSQSTTRPDQGINGDPFAGEGPLEASPNVALEFP